MIDNSQIPDTTIPASAVQSGSFSNWCVKWVYGHPCYCTPGCCCYWQVPTGVEICSIQLYKLIDKIENVEVDEKQIKPFLNDIYKRFNAKNYN